MSTTAADTCVYHPDRPSAGNCANCSQPVCLGCQMSVAGKNVCQRCVSAIRARVASETNAPSYPAPPPPPPASPYGQPQPYGQQPYGQPGSPSSAAYQPYAPAPAMQGPVESMSGGHVFGAIGLGFLAGLVGLVAWGGIVLAIKWNFAFFAIALGWLIGIATVKGAGGRGGNVVAMISAIIAFIFCGIGILPSFFEGQAWGYIFGLICLFYGVRRAYVTPMQASEHW